MKLLVFIVTILAIAVVIPAGTLLAGSSFGRTTQITEPLKQEEKRGVMVQAPQEPVVKSYLPELKVEAPKEVAILPPGPNKVAGLPNEGVVKPEPAKVVEPPQQPVAAPQAPEAAQRVFRQGIPQNYMFRGALLTVHRAVGQQGINTVRNNLSDAQVSTLPKFRDILPELNRQHSAWEYNCRRDPELGCGYGPPSSLLQMTEEELSVFIQMVNPEPPRDRPGVGGDIRRQYDSVVTYAGNRYLLLVDVRWGPP